MGKINQGRPRCLQLSVLGEEQEQETDPSASLAQTLQAGLCHEQHPHWRMGQAAVQMVHSDVTLWDLEQFPTPGCCHGLGRQSLLIFRGKPLISSSDPIPRWRSRENLISFRAGCQSCSIHKAEGKYSPTSPAVSHQFLALFHASSVPSLFPAVLTLSLLQAGRHKHKGLIMPNGHSQLEPSVSPLNLIERKIHPITR